VEERGEAGRVVDDNGQLGEEVLVAETALLQAVGYKSVWQLESRLFRVFSPLSGELALLVGGNELGRQAVGAEVEAALGTTADVVDEGDGALVLLLLVEELVLDGGKADKVAHAGAHVPANALGVDADFAQHADHLGLVCDVGLCAGSGDLSSQLCVVGISYGSAAVDLRHVERVGDLQLTLDVQTDQRSSCDAGEDLRAVLDDAHDDLFLLSTPVFSCILLCLSFAYQSVNANFAQDCLVTAPLSVLNPYKS
jgi:hypothetical protein